MEHAAIESGAVPEGQVVVFRDGFRAECEFLSHEIFLKLPKLFSQNHRFSIILWIFFCEDNSLKSIVYSHLLTVG